MSKAASKEKAKLRALREVLLVRLHLRMNAKSDVVIGSGMFDL